MAEKCTDNTTDLSEQVISAAHISKHRDLHTQV